MGSWSHFVCSQYSRKQKPIALVSVDSLFRTVSQKIDTLVISPRFVITACVPGCAQPRSTLCNPREGNQPAPLSMGFSRHEYWSGLPFPPPGDPPHPGINPGDPPGLPLSHLDPPECWNQGRFPYNNGMGKGELDRTHSANRIEVRGLSESGKGGQTVGPSSPSRVRGPAPRLEGSSLRELSCSGHELTSSSSEFPAARSTGPDDRPWPSAHQLTAALFLQSEDPPRQILPSIFLFPSTSWKISRYKCPLVPSYLFLII